VNVKADFFNSHRHVDGMQDNQYANMDYSPNAAFEMSFDDDVFSCWFKAPTNMPCRKATITFHNRL